MDGAHIHGHGWISAATLDALSTLPKAENGGGKLDLPLKTLYGLEVAGMIEPMTEGRWCISEQGELLTAQWEELRQRAAEED